MLMFGRQSIGICLQYVVVIVTALPVVQCAPCPRHRINFIVSRSAHGSVGTEAGGSKKEWTSAGHELMLEQRRPRQYEGMRREVLIDALNKQLDSYPDGLERTLLLGAMCHSRSHMDSRHGVSTQSDTPHCP